LAGFQQQQAQLESIVAGRDEAALARLFRELKLEKKAPLVQNQNARLRRFLARGAICHQTVISIGGGAPKITIISLFVLLARRTSGCMRLTIGLARIVRNPTRKELPHRTIIEAAHSRPSSARQTTTRGST